MAASAPTYVSNSSGPSTGTSSATGGAVGVGSGGGGGGGYRHTAGASVIGQSAQDYDGLTFFEREKLRLTEEIAAVSGFALSMGVSLSLNVGRISHLFHRAPPRPQPTLSPQQQQQQ